MFCKTHKTDDMIDVKSKKCKDCSKTATYNFDGKKGEFCSVHAKEGMIYVYKNKCKEPGCDIRAKYYYPNGPKTGVFCAKHKKETIIRN